MDAFRGLQGRERFSLIATDPPGRGVRRKTKHYLISLQAASLEHNCAKIKKLTGNLYKAKCVCACVLSKCLQKSYLALSDCRQENGRGTERYKLRVHL